jgi:DNA-binding transcriptional LysR family regulator
VAFGTWATVRDIEVLRTVVRCGSFSAAARELGISQPAISRTIDQIERLSGKRFFQRGDGECVPTADALAVYEESTPVFLGLERIEHFRWVEEPKDTFTIALPPTQAHCFLVRIVPGFREAFPAVRICLEIRTTLEVVSLVAEAAADIGIGEVPPGDWSVKRIPFRRSSLMVALPEKHPLVASRKIGAADLAKEPLILQVRRNPIRSQLERLLSTVDGPPNVIIESSNALSAVQLVGRGLGISLVTAFPVTLHAEPGVVYRPFYPDVEQDTCFILPAARPLKGVTRRFIDYVQEHQPPEDRFSRYLPE